MRYIFCIVIVSILILSGCSNNKLQPLTATTKETQTDSTTEIEKVTVTKPNVIFEISSFSLRYETDTFGSIRTEDFIGDGIITVNGDKELVKNPYLVLLDIKRLSGGGQNDTSSGLRNVIVYNGVGKFDTRDYSSDKEIKMAKPIYEVKIVGYTPYIEYNSAVFTSQ